MKKEFDSEPILNKFFWENKINSYGDKATYFRDQEIPEVWSNYACLSVILIDFVFKKDESYYSQVFLKECKYIEK